MAKGILTATHVGLNLNINNDTAWNQHTTYDNCEYYDFHVNLAGTVLRNNTQKCSIAPYQWKVEDGIVPHFYCYPTTDFAGANTRVMLYVPLETDVNTDFTVVCPLAEPVTYQLTPQ